MLSDAAALISVHAAAYRGGRKDLSQEGAQAFILAREVLGWRFLGTMLMGS